MPSRSRPFPLIPAVLAVLSSLAIPAHPQEPSAPVTAARPDVLLVTVDTLRPDALGWIGGRNETPVMDRLAAEGLRFPGALAPIPITLPSHTSILTGTIPRRHGVRDNGQVVPAEVESLAERLAEAGYSTAGFVSGYPLAAAFGLDQGFGHYDDGGLTGEEGRRERSAEATTEAALGWLQNAPGPRPWFVWVHYYDPHDPYEPPERFRGAGVRGAYDGEVAAVDEALGRLLDGASRPGRRRLTVLTADHGESLGEHGEATHGFFLYQSTIAVPLVVHFPGTVAAGPGERRGALVDVSPTILDAVGLERPDDQDLDGRSLLGPGEDPVAYLETRRPWYSYGWSPLRAVVADGWKLIVAPRPELYDLERDPTESRDSIDDHRPRARALQGNLREIEAAPEVEASAATDPETSQRLAALGYAGAGRSGNEIPTSGLADPKDRIGLWNQLGEAEAARARGAGDTALRLFDAVLAEDPANPFALGRSGALLTESRLARDVQRGIERLERAVALQPADAEAWVALARARGNLRQWDAAADAWREMVRLQPRRAAGWVGLGNALGVSGDPASAVGAFLRATQVAPQDPEVWLRSGFARVAADDPAGAVDDLRRAAELDPARFAHSGALGILLTRMQRPDEARPWLVGSEPGEGDFVAARVELARLELRSGADEAARRALAEAVEVDPGLSTRLAEDPELAPLLP